MNPQNPQKFQIFIQSPDLQIPTRALILQNPNPNSTLSDLKSTIFPKLKTLTLIKDSLYFTLNGKALPDSTPLQNPQITPLSTLVLRLRLLGGGGDGGATGAESRDCYLNMYAEKKPDKVDPNEQRLSKWLNCAISNEPLKHPVVIDKLGNLFNKEVLVEALLKKRVPKKFGYIKGLKDMISIELSVIPGAGDREERFQCPITGLEFNGKYKFFALRTCGHVFSAKALKEVKSSACLVCHTEFTENDKTVINGSDEEVAVLMERIYEERAKLKDNRKVKKGKSGEENGVEVARLSGTKHGIGKVGVNGKIEVKDVSNGSGNGRAVKRFKAVDVAPPNANKEVYASIFTSSRKSDFKETYSCRSLPLGRN